MNVICWNCQGLGNPQTVQFLKNLLHVHNSPRILFLYETICNKRSFEHIRIALRFSACFFVERNGLSGGLALFWYDDLVNIHILSSSASHIDAKIIPNDTTRMWCFMAYYATLSLIHVHILGPF